MKVVIITLLLLNSFAQVWGMGAPSVKKKKKKKKRKTPVHNTHVTQSKPTPKPTVVVSPPAEPTSQVSYQSDIVIKEAYPWIMNQSSIPKKWSIQVQVANTGENPIKLPEGKTLLKVEVLKGKNLFLHPVHLDQERIIPAGESAIFQIPFGFSWSIIQKPRKYKLKIILDPDQQFEDTNQNNNSFMLKGKIFG